MRVKGGFLIWFILSAAILALPQAARADEFARTCTYFANVAFNDRHTREDDTFRVELARDCAVALSLYRRSEPDSAAHAAAGRMLAGLQAYRQVLVDIARDRFEAELSAREAGMMPGEGRPRTVVRPVSRAGEFLIAKVMGLLDTHEAWREWQQASAAAPAD